MGGDRCAPYLRGCRWWCNCSAWAFRRWNSSWMKSVRALRISTCAQGQARMELTGGLGRPRPTQELRSTHRGPIFCPEPLEHRQRAEGLPDEHGDSLWATPGLGAKAPQSWGLAPHYGPRPQPASPLPLPGASHSATSHVCPMYLSKAGEIGWAVREHVVHSCSGSRHQVRVGMALGSPCQPSPALTTLGPTGGSPTCHSGRMTGLRRHSAIRRPIPAQRKATQGGSACSPA